MIVRYTIDVLPPLKAFESDPMPVDVLPKDYDGQCMVTYLGYKCSGISEANRIVSGNLWKRPE